MTISATVTGVSELAARMNRLQSRTDAALLAGVRRGLQQGEGIVKGNASGRPGPRAITGDHRRGITSGAAVGGSGVEGFVGANSAQAARLEYGFYGTDSLGRTYNQPPYPYLAPSVPGVAEAVVSNVVDQLGKIAA